MDVKIILEFNRKTVEHEYRNMTYKAVVQEIIDLTLSNNKIVAVIDLDATE
jgi:hypothetical protein